ncbi:MAG: DUF2911 domain-containing protein [Mucilaginibacter sp.]
MKTSFKFTTVLAIVIACLFSGAAMAQMDSNGKEKKAPLSPRDSVSGTIKGTMISINYGSPSVRGRKIWDDLVPYGKVWRTGANEATRFTTDKEITVEGKTLPAGTYGFFAIPSANQWTIIFNSVANQWGAFKYDSTKDVLRVTVTPKKAGKHERLVYKINSKGFELDWAELAVPVRVD